MAKSNSKSLRGQAKDAGINLKELFPRSKIKANRKLTKYQEQKIKAALKKKSKVPKYAKQVLYPDRPDIWEQGGFESDGKKHTHIRWHTSEKHPEIKIQTKSYWWSGGERIFPSSEKITNYELYKSEGNLAYYKAHFFGGVINAVFVPIMNLHQFILDQIEADHIHGKWYDKISLREGDRDIHGGSKGLDWLKDSAEDLMIYLEQYKRHGSLIGEGGTFTYIQVCFINFGG